MRRLVEIIGAKMYALSPEDWKSEADAVQEVTDAFNEDLSDPMIEALSEWIFERTGEVLDTNLD